MRDIIWTVIVVWFIYKLVDLFKAGSAKKTVEPRYDQQASHSDFHSGPRAEKDIKNAVKKHLNNEGEYVDFEEVK